MVLSPLICLTALTGVRAAVEWSGDLRPEYPASWSPFSTVYIGDAADGTLDITNGDRVSCSNCYLGYAAGATGRATLDGIGSQWGMLDLFVGEEGRGVLDVTDGGTLYSDISTIGNQPGSSGEVTVNGADSRWINDELIVGHYGVGTLNILDTASVEVTRNTVIRCNAESPGTIHFDNGTLVTGGLICDFDNLSGTGVIQGGGLVGDVDLIFDATHGLEQTLSIADNPGQDITLNLDVSRCGSLGAGHSAAGTLRIADGIVVQSYDGHLGYQGGSTGETIVEGTGSKWLMNGSLYVGEGGRGSLDVTAGGTLTSRICNIGAGPTASGQIRINGVDSKWTIGTALFVGAEGSGTLEIAAGATLENHGAGTLGDQPGATGVATVTGSGSTWTNAEDILVGNHGSGTLDITGGATVISVEGFIAKEPDSLGRVAVEGNGSTWSNEDKLYVGYSGKGSLVVQNGGRVFSSEGSVKPNPDVPFGVTVDGAGSKWTNDGHLGISGSLAVTGGGEVSNETGFVNSGSGSTACVTVSGAGSNWTNRSTLGIADGELTVGDGGRVSSGPAYIGLDKGMNASVTVDGAGSQWTAGEYFRVGDRGGGTLTISGGGHVSNDAGYIGFSSECLNGAVTVSGPNSMWTNRTLAVGHFGDGMLNLLNGGTVVAEESTRLGEFPSGSGSIHFDGGTLTTNELVCKTRELRGTGTINVRVLKGDFDLVFDATHGLTQTFALNKRPDQNITVNLDFDGSVPLVVGYDDPGSMRISDGVVVPSASGTVGCNWHFPTTATVTVDGPGSTWRCAGDITVAESGVGILEIRGGGRVENEFAVIGHDPGARGEVTVDGPGSVWVNSADLNVGDSGSGTLVISNGGHVRDADAAVPGWNASGYVAVDGPGSTWTHSGSLSIGSIGGGNVVVTAGGRVDNADATMSGSLLTSAHVTVDGEGSTWINRGDLTVGTLGAATLTVSNGGLVRVDGTLTTNSYSTPLSTKHGVINIESGGMLAVRGQSAPYARYFLELVEGTDAIRYWDVDEESWTKLLDGFWDRDYTLKYMAEGPWEGYMLLRVGIMDSFTFPGDLDSDGRVGSGDLDLIRANWGETVSPGSCGDATDEGIVNASDLDFIRATWGIDTTAVPEPSAWRWLLAIVTGGAFRRRRSRTLSTAIHG